MLCTASRKQCKWRKLMPGATLQPGDSIKWRGPPACISQAKRVSVIAERLYADVRPDASAEARRELLWASALHEMGMMVSHHDHHRHSAYLLGHVDAAGFSQSQLKRLGELVLAQRGGLRKIEASLSQPGFAWQVLCLRLAIIKCHARGEVDEHALNLARDGTVATLRFSKAWEQANPRKIHLIREEVDAWSRSAAIRLELGR